MKIEIDDLSRSEVHGLLNVHLENMVALSPRESVHALDLGKIQGSTDQIRTARRRAF